MYYDGSPAQDHHVALTMADGDGQSGFRAPRYAGEADPYGRRASGSRPGLSSLASAPAVTSGPRSPLPPAMHASASASRFQYSPSQYDAYAPRPPPSPRSAPPQTGFRRLRDGAYDLRPVVRERPHGRRTDASGAPLSPLRALTTHLAATYQTVNPAFRYEHAHNPRRVLTKPSVPAGNEGVDNEDADYILYVNDVLGSTDGHRYLILDVLGQGTFGQVVKCQNMLTHEIVAVKVVKNKPAYFQQSMMEVTILELLNNTWDPTDEHHILRLKDTFIHFSHLCLVFELLSSNLYELIKQNSFRGLSTSLVRVFTEQLLDSLTVLNEARLIHCDLKPENILLKTLQSPVIKIIDFGSACHERQTVYTYIQSRFYRSPEVLLGLPYSSAIDMWSLGCICVELFLGLPLFPGTSEYNQISRIVETLGVPPDFMVQNGKQAAQFFEPRYDVYGQPAGFGLKSMERYAAERGVTEQPSKKYFAHTALPDIVRTYPSARKNQKPADLEKEAHSRLAFIDFVSGLLNLNPVERWTPQQAKLHPFITGEPFVRPFAPPSQASLVAAAAHRSGNSSPGGSVPPSPRQSGHHQSPSAGPSQERPYGGLPPTPARSGQRTYHDAAAYSQHLAQQQIARSRPPPNLNPYAAPPPPAAVHHPPPGSGYGSRGRAGSDAVPPQLQRLGLDLSNMPGQSLTPILRRDDQRAAWERRGPGGHGRKASISRNPQHVHELDWLTEQAELVGAGMGVGSFGTNAAGWPHVHPATPRHAIYPPSPQHPHGFSLIVDGSGNPLSGPQPLPYMMPPPQPAMRSALDQREGADFAMLYQPLQPQPYASPAHQQSPTFAPPQNPSHSQSLLRSLHRPRSRDLENWAP